MPQTLCKWDTPSTKQHQFYNNISKVIIKTPTTTFSFGLTGLLVQSYTRSDKVLKVENLGIAAAGF